MENKELYKALAQFQQDAPTINRSSSGYGYKYADLPAIFEAINPLLKKYGLGFTQPIRDNKLVTILFHIETGQSLESEVSLLTDVKLAKMNDFQVLGSQITYLRRYSLSALLGIVTDDDTDAAGVQVSQPKRTIQDAIAEMQKCDTIGRLQTCWTKHKEFQRDPLFVESKDKQKQKLTT